MLNLFPFSWLIDGFALFHMGLWFLVLIVIIFVKDVLILLYCWSWRCSLQFSVFVLGLFSVFMFVELCSPTKSNSRSVFPSFESFKTVYNRREYLFWPWSIWVPLHELLEEPYIGPTINVWLLFGPKGSHMVNLKASLVAHSSAPSGLIINLWSVAAGTSRIADMHITYVVVMTL